MSNPEEVYSNEYGTDGDCSSCGIWINNIESWYCDKCKEPTCEYCGKLEEDNKQFLCPNCFYKV